MAKKSKKIERMLREIEEQREEILARNEELKRDAMAGYREALEAVKANKTPATLKRMYMKRIMVIMAYTA